MKIMTSTKSLKVIHQEHLTMACLKFKLTISQMVK